MRLSRRRLPGSVSSTSSSRVPMPPTSLCTVSRGRCLPRMHPPPRHAPPKQPAAVDFTWPPTPGNTSTVLTFAAQASDDHDPPNAIQVRWDWNGDGTWDTPWSTTKTATHTFGAVGDYTIVVRAIDSGGLTTSKSNVVSVTALPPPPNGTNPLSTQTQILLLLASVSTPIMIVTPIR